MPKYSVDQVLDALSANRIRATYSAVASVLGTHPKLVAGEFLGEKRPRASWVVSRDDHMPTSYHAQDRHPDLQSRKHVIDDPAELIDLIQKH